MAWKVELDASLAADERGVAEQAEDDAVTAGATAFDNNAPEVFGELDVFLNE